MSNIEDVSVVETPVDYITLVNAGRTGDVALVKRCLSAGVLNIDSISWNTGLVDPSSDSNYSLLMAIVTPADKTRYHPNLTQSTCDEIVGLVVKAGASIDYYMEATDQDVYDIASMYFRGEDQGSQLYTLALIKCNDLWLNTPPTPAILLTSSLGLTKAVQELIKAGVDVNVADKNLRTPLHYACGSRFSPISDLVKQGARMDVFDSNKLTPLQVACKCGNVDAIATLLAAGADIELCHRDEDFTPLHIACSHQRLDAINTLVKAGADIEADGPYHTPLFQSVGKDQLEVAKLLVELKANVHAVDSNGFNLLHYPAKYALTDMLVYMLSLGVDVAPKTKSKDAPLHQLCQRNQPQFVQTFIEKKADVNALNSFKETPLIIACKYQLPDVADILIKNGAMTDVLDYNGESLLHIATRNGDEDMIMMLKSLNL